MNNIRLDLPSPALLYAVWAKRNDDVWAGALCGIPSAGLETLDVWETFKASEGTMGLACTGNAKLNAAFLESSGDDDDLGCLVDVADI